MHRQIKRLGAGVSIHDVGNHAGVSHTTVSRVIRGDIQVSGKTRARVIAAMDALNYVPNQNARALVGSPAVTMGIPILTTAPNIDRIVSGIAQQAILQNCRLTSRQFSNPLAAASMVRELVAAGAQGVILIAPLCEDPLILGELAGSGVATVLVGSDGPVPGYPSITIDECKAAADVTRHLLNLGHRKIGFIQSAAEERSSSKIILGYVSAIRQANIDTDLDLVRLGFSNYRGGLRATESLLKAIPDMTAIFAANDQMAAAAIDVAQQAGMAIPRELSVAGFGDASIAAIMSPHLTTVRFPFFEMGREALKLLIAEIGRHGDEGAVQSNIKRVLDHQLICRETT